MIRKPEDGSVLSVTLQIKGETKTFKLTIVKRYLMASSEIEYAYVSDDGLCFFGFYSGGVTGGGASNIMTLKQAGVEIITTDIDEIYRQAEKAEKDAEKEKENFNKKKMVAVVKINAMPKIFPVEGIPEVLIERDEAKYDPRYSSKIHCPVRVKTIDGQSIYLNDYVTNDGKLLTQKFARQMHSLFDDVVVKKYEPKTMLRKINNRLHEVMQMVKDVETNPDNPDIPDVVGMLTEDIRKNPDKYVWDEATKQFKHK